jgi:hypothetical protein
MMIDVRERLRTTRPVRITTSAAERQDSRVLGMTAFICGVGLLIQSFGEVAGHHGAESLALTLLMVGVTVIFAGCGWQLIGTNATGSERRNISVLLGVSLLLSSYFLDPLLFTGFDDLLHQTTLWQLLAHHQLFTRNTELPVSPYYPGLELLTVGIRSMTGLPTVLSELSVLLIARVVLVVSFYTVAQRLLRSDRAAGVAVLIYAASPQFYAFNSAYAYQSVALAFAAAAVALVVWSMGQPEPRVNRWILLADLSLICLALTHHLVSWITATVFICWASIARRWVTHAQMKLLMHVAIVSVAVTGIWTGIASAHVAPYIMPIISGAVAGLAHLVGGGHVQRHPFQSSGELSTTGWQAGLMLISAGLFFGVVLLGARDIIKGKDDRRGPFRWLVILLAFIYLIDLACSLTFATQEVGQRASTFVFFGIALVGALVIARARKVVVRGLSLCLAVIAFLGSLFLGSGPAGELTPGPYIPAADQRSVLGPSLAAAHWAAANLPIESRIAADRDNAALMAAVGHLAPVNALSGAINVGQLYFDKVFGPYDKSVIARYRIRYLLVDTRLELGPPAFGNYFAPGETPGRERLGPAQLDKFSRVAGMKLIYNDGPIRIYDDAKMLGISPTSSSHADPSLNSGGNIGAAVVLFGLCLLLVARRRRFAEQQMIGVMVFAMGLAMLLGLGTVFQLWPPIALELAVVGVTAIAVVHRLVFRETASVSGSRRAPAILGALLFAGGSLGAVTGGVVSAVSAANAGRAGDSLSAQVQPNGQVLVSSTLTSAPRGLLELRLGATVLWSDPVRSGATRIVVPLTSYPNGTKFVLVAKGKVQRSVSS